MDRHFLSLIESKVCIGSIDEPLVQTQSTTGTSYPKSTIESLRLILAQKFNDPPLNFRELPVSLLRLYFSGRQRLTRFISRLPQRRFNTLVHFLEQDGVTLPSIVVVDNSDLYYTDPLYKQKCAAIEIYIQTLLEHCLCSFETSLSHVIQALHTPDDDGKKKIWHRFGLLDALEHGSHWANFHIPDGVRSPEQEKQYCLWLTCVWRINVTLSLCKLLSPWDDDEGKEWISYQFKLFRATHLDLLSYMFKHRVYDDESVSTKHHLLRDFYPLCNRVCCAEELPDFVGYATDNFKTGSNLKERSELDDMIGHLYVNKTGPNICKIRNFYDIIIRYGEEHPIIYDILKNVIKCVLMGNLPHSKGSLNMQALVEINLFLSPEEADAVISEEEFKELTKNKSMKRNRSKKKTKDELVYTKTRFILWLLECRHFVLYLQKELLFYIAETSGWLNDLLSVDYKFTRYREIVLIGNGQCRNKLSEQARRKVPGSPFDWSEIEFEEKSTETYDTKSGEIKKYHAWSLTKARKVQKDDFMKILAKKMTNTEETLNIEAILAYRPFYYIESLGEVPNKEEGRMISLEDLHFICWCMSKNKSRIMETRWFQVIGMSKKGLETLREWLFMYNTYDIPDNSLKKLIKAFHNESSIDYMMLKTVIKIIEYYKQDVVFHLPISYAKKQIYALRQLLGIQDWEPTPPLLGYSYQCPGCQRFANTIIEPIDHSNKQYCSESCLSANGGNSSSNNNTTNPRIASKGGNNTATAVASTKKNDKLALTVSKQTKSSSVWTSGGGENGVKGEDTKKRIGGRKAKGKDKKTGGKAANASTTNNATSCFLNMCFYSMDTGKLHCSKYSSNYKHTLLSDDLANGPIVMRKRDNSIIIRSNKVILVKPGDEEPLLLPAATTTTPKTKKLQGQSSSQASKEREAKKFQWLLERRIFDFNDTNGGDDALNDNVACGLYAATETPQEDDPDHPNSGATTAATTTTTTIEITPTTTGKKNNKKIILGHMNKALTDYGLTCNKELNAIDMIGMVKNLYVYCTEPDCCSMTELRNYNITNHGITCGRHKNMYESDYNIEPSLSNPDKRSEAADLKKRNASLVVLGDQSPHYQHDAEGSNTSSMPPSMLTIAPNAILYPHSTYLTNQALKANLHPLDLIEKGKLFSLQSGHIESERCAYCDIGASKYRLTCTGYHKKIMKVALCKSCYGLCTPINSKHHFLPLSDIYAHLKNKRPLL